MKPIWKIAPAALILISLGALGAVAALGDEPKPKKEGAAPPAKEAAAPVAAPGAAAPRTAAPGAQPSQEEVLNELFKRRAENPLIEPAKPVAPTSALPGGPGGGPQLLPQPLSPQALPVVPAAPAASTGGGATSLTEGQFVINRRGRLIPAGAGWFFHFDSDRGGPEDAPMPLLPCQLLETMEAGVRQRGEAAAFIISGQVLTYRGGNYLLPTLTMLAPETGNIRP